MWHNRPCAPLVFFIWYVEPGAHWHCVNGRVTRRTVDVIDQSVQRRPQISPPTVWSIFISIFITTLIIMFIIIITTTTSNNNSSSTTTATTITTTHTTNKATRFFDREGQRLIPQTTTKWIVCPCWIEQQAYCDVVYIDLKGDSLIGTTLSFVPIDAVHELYVG